MKHFESGKLGKTVVVEFERGEKLLEGIESKLKEAGVQNAVVGSAVGSLQKLVYHRPTDLGPSAVDEILTIEAPMELGSLTGSVIGGAGHFHIVASDTENVYCGHLDPGTEVLYLLEVIMVELEDCNLERRVTPENVKKLFLK